MEYEVVLGVRRLAIVRVQDAWSLDAAVSKAKEAVRNGDPRVEMDAGEGVEILSIASIVPGASEELQSPL